MEFTKGDRVETIKTPKWWSKELEQAILDTEGTIETVVLKVGKEEIKSMGAKIREYIGRKFHKPITIRTGEGFLRVWVPTEMEVKDARAVARTYSSKRGGE